MNVLDLFSGIGGWALGLERAGFTTVAFCERDETGYAQAVLRKHWPHVPIYDDVRTISASRLARDGIGVDCISASWPCQDISYAGKGAGLAGERSGLWREVARLVGELRPRYLMLENVAALLSRGLGDVLGDLAEVGYDAEWHCIPASAIGAPHRRDRWWAVAYPHGEPATGGVDPGTAKRGPKITPTWAVELRNASRGRTRSRLSDVADASGSRGAAGLPGQESREERHSGEPNDGRSEQPWRSGCSQWLVEPDLDRVADGVPARAHRLRCLGNAVVPQIPEIIGRAIMAADRETDSNG